MDMEDMRGNAFNSAYGKAVINYHRYIDTSEQVRRMSVAMVLIVDQLYMQDVLSAFSSTKEPVAGISVGSDTKLRMQPTQMHWQHVPDDIVWEEDLKQPDALARMPAGPFVRGSSFGGVGGVRPGASPASPFGSQYGGMDEEKSDLVELSMYGILSLYERFPDAPAPGETPQPPGGATPPPTATK
jgi:hypothetical protein